MSLKARRLLQIAAIRYAAYTLGQPGLTDEHMEQIVERLIVYLDDPTLGGATPTANGVNHGPS